MPKTRKMLSDWNASEDLRNEHEGVLFGLDILKEMINTVQQSSTVDTKNMEE